MSFTCVIVSLPCGHFHRCVGKKQIHLSENVEFTREEADDFLRHVLFPHGKQRQSCLNMNVIHIGQYFLFHVFRFEFTWENSQSHVKMCEKGLSTCKEAHFKQLNLPMYVSMCVKSKFHIYILKKSVSSHITRRI